MRYTASFVLTKPADMSQASDLLRHDVPNRGSPNTIGVAERNFGDVGLASAWQGDNSGSAGSGPASQSPTVQANPVPHTQRVIALRVHFRNWVLKGTRPPDSVYTMFKAEDDHDDDGRRHDARKGNGDDDDSAFAGERGATLAAHSARGAPAPRCPWRRVRAHPRGRCPAWHGIGARLRISGCADLTCYGFG